MKTYIICYDIPDDKRRNKVATLLEGYGERRQYSVFECHLKDPQFAKLWEKLGKLIDDKQDSILCYPLSPQAQKRVRSLGVASPLLKDPDYYLA
jgi:CRISPR-associated protein Cas2